MSEPTACTDACCPDSTYCSRCDLLVGLDGLRVIDVVRADDALTVTVESAPGAVGCPRCGVIAASRGRRAVTLIDAPSFNVPVRTIWRKRTWRCVEPTCPIGSFTEQNEDVAKRRGLLTRRACWWAVGQIRREHASVAGVCRQLGTTWNTVWSAIKPLLVEMDKDPGRFDGVTTLGVDEHIWHHVSTKPVSDGGRGPKELTGMVDLTRDANGRVRARLLDLVPGRSGPAYADWLKQRDHAFRDGVQIATLDPFQGYKNAIDDQLEDATAVLDAFHVVKLGTQAVDEVRRRVQQDTLGHRGRRGDPLYGIRNILRCGRERLTAKQNYRLHVAFTARDEHVEVDVAWQCASQLRDAYHLGDLTEGRKIAERVLAMFPTCPIPEIRRLGKTLNRWKDAFLSYWSTGRSNNGGTEAVNGLIELHRRVARGFRNRDNYRLRMLLIGGALTSPHLK